MRSERQDHSRSLHPTAKSLSDLEVDSFEGQNRRKGWLILIAALRVGVDASWIPTGMAAPTTRPR
jgi:hypothetical protein